MSNVLHVFFDVNMGLGFQGLGAILETKTKKDLGEGECAVFLNKRWSAAKILYPGNVFVYWRNERSSSIDYAALCELPSRLAAGLKFSAKAERAIVAGAADPAGRPKRVPRVRTEEGESYAGTT